MIQATIGDLEKILSVDYVTASSVVKLMIANGSAREVGKRATATGKGKPSKIYELEETFTITLTPQLVEAGF